MTVEERFEEASPKKIGKTGNVVLDKINEKVEQQREEEESAAKQGMLELSVKNLAVFNDDGGSDDSPLRKPQQQ